MLFCCNSCGTVYKSEDVLHGFRCRVCGAPLEICNFIGNWRPRGFGLSRYQSMLPLKLVKSLGEGSTPIVSAELYGVKVYFKLEYLNPSGSFKDRGSAVSLSHAFSVKALCSIEDSSGNAGFSVALYSRVLGIEPYIVVPSSIAYGKRLAIEVVGGNIVEVSSREEASDVAKKISLEKNCYYIDHLSSPLYIEGYKTISYEVFEEIGEVDAIISPVGSGGLFIGIYRGFSKLYEMGLIKKKPRMIAVQGVDVAPVYERLYGFKYLDGTSSLADGIRIASPPRIDEVVKIIIESKGTVVLVNDSEIISSIKELIDMGFIVEPTSATAYAALKKLIGKLMEMGAETIVIPLTGAGIKMLQQLKQLLR
ncbi:MAG: pyridoxal-phosphate dependent enzyme [Ignisphaera sp.]